MILGRVACKLLSLTRTEKVLTEDTLRVYLQAQWLGNNKNSQNYGWKMALNGLMPVLWIKKTLSDDLMESVSCQCKTRCKTRTRKLGQVLKVRTV